MFETVVVFSQNVGRIECLCTDCNSAFIFLYKMLQTSMRFKCCSFVIAPAMLNLRKFLIAGELKEHHSLFRDKSSKQGSRFKQGKQSSSFKHFCCR